MLWLSVATCAALGLLSESCGVISSKCDEIETCPEDATTGDGTSPGSVDGSAQDAEASVAGDAEPGADEGAGKGDAGSRDGGLAESGGGDGGLVDTGGDSREAGSDGGLHDASSLEAMTDVEGVGMDSSVDTGTVGSDTGVVDAVVFCDLDGGPDGCTITKCCAAGRCCAPGAVCCDDDSAVSIVHCVASCLGCTGTCM